MKKFQKVSVIAEIYKNSRGSTRANKVDVKTACDVRRKSSDVRDERDSRHKPSFQEKLEENKS